MTCSSDFFSGARNKEDIKQQRERERRERDREGETDRQRERERERERERASLGLFFGLNLFFGMYALASVCGCFFGGCTLLRFFFCFCLRATAL